MTASPSFMKAVFIYSEDSHLALRQAAARGDNRKIKSLLENEKIEDINRCGADSGKTALHQAAAKAKKETVKLLISLGANPTLKDKSSKSPRELALSTEDKTIASLLQLTEYAYEAIQTAKAVFYIPMSQDAIKFFKIFFQRQLTSTRLIGKDSRIN